MVKLVVHLPADIHVMRSYLSINCVGWDVSAINKRLQLGNSFPLKIADQPDTLGEITVVAKY